MNRTSIEWCDYTWNTTYGCTHVSDGCRNCYAEAIALRFGHSQHPWTAAHEVQNVKVKPEKLQEPFKLKEPGQKVFVDSMSDLFHRLVPDDHIAKVFSVMACCRQHVFQILTKRPERMRTLLNDPAFVAEIRARANQDIWLGKPSRGHRLSFHSPFWPLPNVWLGTSIEDQRVVSRIDDLVATPAAIRFLSCEPLIGPLDLTSWLWEEAGPEWAGKNPSPDLDWVIVGGESGPHFRPINLDWARRIRDDCVEAGIAFFFKQHGGRTPKAGGRLLDDREWNQMPGDPQRAAEQIEMGALFA